MRVLFSSTSGHGHVFPMLQLATAFRDAGHDVRWAVAGGATPLVAATGVDAVACGADGAEEKALRGAVLRVAQELPGDQRAPYVFPRMFGAALAPAMAADLVPLVREWAPDLLVHEQAELAAPLAGAVAGVPVVTHSFGTAIPVPILDDTRQRLAGLWAEHGLEVPPYAGCFADGYLDICPPAVQATSVEHIGEVLPLRPVTAAPVTPGDPLVYVTLGTVANQPELMRDVLAGVATVGVPVLAALGPGQAPESVGPQPGHVRVETWVDQAAVLGSCTAVVSHGGSGTFLGALAHGLPQLCVPRAADQFRNAEGGLRAGAVRVLRPDEVTPDAVGATLGALLADDAVREAARAVAAEIAAMPSPADVVDRLAQR